MADAKEIRQRIGVLRDQLKNAVQKEFSEGIKDIFIRYPKLGSISWAQYTPYFNDGDTCTFGSNVSGKYAEINRVFYDGGPEEYISVSSLEYRKKRGEAFAPGFEECVKELCEFLGTFTDEDYLSLFGDHVRVTVTKDGIDTDEYDHD